MVYKFQFIDILVFGVFSPHVHLLFVLACFFIHSFNR
jgi:hypothetical protein